VSRIVCNSGPLIALGILGRLDILKSLFDEVLVPEAVQREIEQGVAKLSGLEDFRRADWIRIVPLTERRDELLESAP
jgi:predicted nucleic acid-binding protein